MKQNDRFLIGIVVGAVLLIAVAFGVTLLSPKTTYRADDSPENIVHNYLLALQEVNYERAYGYLDPELKGYPTTVNEFILDIEGYAWTFRQSNDFSLSIESASVSGDNATVSVRETNFYANGFLDRNQYSNVFKMRLHQTASGWKIMGGDQYFSWCWEDGTCRK